MRERANDRSVRRSADAAVAGRAPKDHGFLPHFDIKRVNERDGGFLARVPRASKYAEANEIVSVDLQPLDNGRTQFGIAMVEREFHLHQSEHRGTPSPLRSNGGQIPSRRASSAR